jgi:hypothetical protein
LTGVLSDVPYGSPSVLEVKEESKETMQAFHDEGHRVIKKQRLCAEQIHRHLDLLLTEVETAKTQLIEKQNEYKRKRSRYQETHQRPREGENTTHVDVPAVEVAEDEIDHIVQEFIERVKMLNLEKSIADELKVLHVALSKYGKQIDKVRTLMFMILSTFTDHFCKIAIFQ